MKNLKQHIGFFLLVLTCACFAQQVPVSVPAITFTNTDAQPIMIDIWNASPGAAPTITHLTLSNSRPFVYQTLNNARYHFEIYKMANNLRSTHICSGRYIANGTKIIVSPDSQNPQNKICRKV